MWQASESTARARPFSATPPTAVDAGSWSRKGTGRTATGTAAVAGLMLQDAEGAASSASAGVILGVIIATVAWVAVMVGGALLHDRLRRLRRAPPGRVGRKCKHAQLPQDAEFIPLDGARKGDPAETYAL